MTESTLDTHTHEMAEKGKQKLEAQLQHAQEMEAIATLAGGIAHQFNNALVGITGNLELLKMDLANIKTVDKYIAPMTASVRRMAHLTSQLLAYAQGGKYQPKTISLNTFVEDTLPLIKHSSDPSITVEMDLSRNFSNIKADLTQMQMVLSALMANASEAMEGPGCIRVYTRTEEIGEIITKQFSHLKPGRYVCLTVEDNGKGMDPETKAKIFNPFFSTKFQGRGLGMSAVYGIVKNHNGLILVDSELGKGTVVHVYLPAVETTEKEVYLAKPEVTHGTGTVLVIEDEDIVMNVSRAMLERLDYRVLGAKTGGEAIDIAKTYDDDIDLALLDTGLPDMGGDKVYPLIKKARPDLKVIVCSGYSIDGPAQEILDAGAQSFIQKPYSISTLSERLKEALKKH